MEILKSGQKLIHELDNGDEILYNVVEDLRNPIRKVESLSKLELSELKT
jgi:hypothetical protein